MRETIQQKLEEINTEYTHIDIGAEVPDDMLENSTTYFSFTFADNFVDSDMDNNFTKRVEIIGYVKRLVNSNENTLEIVDSATDDIISKLKELNIRCSSDDVSMLDNIRKIRITGTGMYNEINNKLV